MCVCVCVWEGGCLICDECFSPVQIFVQLTEKDMEGKEEETEDASVPRPSLVSTSSRISLEASNKAPVDDVFVDEELHEEKGKMILSSIKAIVIVITLQAW